MSQPLTGLLFSQVGYDPAYPIRVIVRSTESGFLSSDASCGLAGQCCVLKFWGSLWGSLWWVAEFPPGLAEGTWKVCVSDHGQTILEADGLVIESDILWKRTLFAMSVEMLESRAVMAKAKCGWMDAGAMWQESNAQSSMILGLLDVLEFGPHRLSPEVARRIALQVINGCDYLALTQKKAAELGHPAGALCHDIIGHEQEILPNDAFKAVVAWRRAARILPPEFKEASARFSGCADQTLHWLTTSARPLGDKGFCRFQRGLDETTSIPADEWPTRDLIMLCWGAFETWRLGQEDAIDLCTKTAKEIMTRQIPASQPEAGFYGHFREFASCEFSENSWAHSIFGGEFGADAGGTFPNYLVVFVEMVKAWPNHPDARAWRSTLECFASGFLIPACEANPFHLVPQGIFGNEGALWFTGTFHGMNGIYGLTAALALELHSILGRPELIPIAYGNLQWIAGLNAGLTKSAMETGCVIYRTDLNPGEAVPVSMIHGIGRRTAGTWFGTRGVVCNGFATGRQFEFDTACLRSNDGPHSFTDEDWIPHSAGWLSGLVRLPSPHLP